MEEVRKSASYTLAEIAHAMESRAHPNAKLRRIAALTAQHSDMVYSALGLLAVRKRSVVPAIGAEPEVEYFDDEVEEADEAWPDDEADEARPATGGAGDVYDDDAKGHTLDATESTSGSSASTGIRKHRGEPWWELPIVKKARPDRNPTPRKTPVPPNYPPPHLRLGLNTYTF